MFGFLKKNTDNYAGSNMVMLTEADIKKLKHNHGVVLFFMNGCGHCVNMKDDWNAAVNECRNNGIGNADDDFVLGAIESGNTDMFQKHGITTNVNGYPTILYITSEGIKNGNTNHEKYEKPREKQKFIEWIKEKKNRKKSKNVVNETPVNNKNNKNNKNKGKQSGGGRRRTYRRKQTRKSRTRTKRNTYRRRHRHMKGGGGGCGCGPGGLF
jgi:hypothetical protein